jgi:hypothetical protein
MSSKVKKLQAIIDGDWRFAAAAREACKNNTWREFQLLQQPKPFVFNVFALVSYNRCLSKCIELFNAPTIQEMMLIPVWMGNNLDDDPIRHWEKAYVMKIGDQPLSIIENSSITKYSKVLFDLIITLKVRVWDVGILIKSSAYSSSVPLVIRGIPYGVLDNRVIEVDEILKEENQGIDFKT